MKRELISEDSNQFGPGTDLVICLLALLMVMVMIVSFLYNSEKNLNKILETKLDAYEGEGKFKLDVGRFDNATFKQIPPDELAYPEKTREQVLHIVEKYKDLKNQYPFIFVIGHANEMGKLGEKLSDEERQEFNWGVAGVRATVIANLLQSQLLESQFPKETRNNIIVVSTGEFDLKNPQDSKALENANVEIIFGKDWKLK
jgi:hypothetical protein